MGDFFFPFNLEIVGEIKDSFSPPFQKYIVVNWTHHILPIQNAPLQMDSGSFTGG